AEPERDVWPARDRRPDMSAGKDVWGDKTADGPPQPFFGSRWVPAPAHVRDLGPTVGLPRGFRAAGVACGIKPSGRPDLGLLLCDAQSSVSAARFPARGARVAPGGVLGALPREGDARRAGGAHARALPSERAARGARELWVRERGDWRARSR